MRNLLNTAYPAIPSSLEMQTSFRLQKEVTRQSDLIQLHTDYTKIIVLYALAYKGLQRKTFLDRDACEQAPWTVSLADLSANLLLLKNLTAGSGFFVWMLGWFVFFFSFQGFFFCFFLGFVCWSVGVFLILQYLQKKTVEHWENKVMI